MAGHINHVVNFA